MGSWDETCGFSQQNVSYGVCGLTKQDGFTDVETIFYGIERGYLSLRLTDLENNIDDYGLGFMLIKKDVLGGVSIFEEGKLILCNNS